MPFTFAHPAAVIPFCKKHQYVSVTALVLGGMAPDFEYFLHFRPYGIIGHAWLDPYFQILQIGSIIVSELISVLCGIFIVSVVYQIRDN